MTASYRLTAKYRFSRIGVDRKVEMVSFKLSEELRKMFFHLVTSMGQRKKNSFLEYE